MSGTILITGCSRGIGRALAEKFTAEGWRVFATARQVGALDGLEDALPLDVCDAASVEQAVQVVSSACNHLDILVNNAAVFPGEGDEGLLDVDLDWFHESFASNVVGVARVSRAFLPLLRQSAHPRLVNISSGAGSISEKEDHSYYPYSVSKAALNMLTRAMAAEFPDVVVVPVSPGWVRTDMGGESAPLTPAQSADSLYHTITHLTLDQSGKFLGRDGEAYAW